MTASSSILPTTLSSAKLVVSPVWRLVHFFFPDPHVPEILSLIICLRSRHSFVTDVLGLSAARLLLLKPPSLLASYVAVLVIPPRSEGPLQSPLLRSSLRL